MKELRSAVEKARSDQLAKKATLGLEQSKLAGLERLRRNPVAGTEPQQRILQLVERARCRLRSN